jgi:alkylation response protein AidB-like acyl-CoA dehydrogenase
MAARDADWIEREQRLPPPLHDALAQAGLYKMLVPRRFGGSEADPETFIRVVEEISRWDGSTGWCLFIGACCGIAAGSLSVEAAWEVFGRDTHAYLAGSGVPSPNAAARPPDRAIAVDGGFRISGSWSFASGCLDATWLCGITTVYHGDKPSLGPNGFPEKYWFLFPVDQCRILDTWHVTGLRGTGSRDFAVTDVFVPRAHAIPQSYFQGVREGGPLYVYGAVADRNDRTATYSASPWRGLGSIGFAGVLLGIARGALDAFAELAATKSATGGKDLLREDQIVQSRIGEAESTLRSARAYVYEAIREAWQTVLDTGGPTEETRVAQNLAGTHAAALASNVVDTVWHLAGTSGIREGHPLERRFRDVHVGRQNIAVSPATYGVAGRMLLKSEARATNY